MMYRRNVGNLPKNTIAGLLWDIVADTSQFFCTLTSEEDYNATPQVNMPVSTLLVKRSILSEIFHLDSIDTPKYQLPRVPTGVGDKNVLGRTRQQQLDYDRRYHSSGGGTGGGYGGNVDGDTY